VAGRNAAHIIPNAWKFGETPAPMLVTLEVDDAAGTARLVGEIQPNDPDVTSGPDLATRITEYVKAHPDQSGNEVAKGVRAGKEKVQRALDDLRDEGTLSSKPGPRGANLWSVAERPSGSD
jgi:hypothetical protein